MRTIKKYQPGGRISGKVPKSVKVDTANTIKQYRKISNLPPAKKVPSRKKDVDLSAPGEGMMKELMKKGSMPPSQKNVGRRGIKVGKDGNWIQKAVNPKHKGYCTPMTKATCTPRRKALAKTFKKMGRARKGK